jgi:hypothetical protein
MVNSKNVGFIAALLVVGLLLVFAFGYRTKIETVSLTYFADNTYRPTSDLPELDGQGRPKVVMVRKSGLTECFDVLYSRKLRELMQSSPSRQAAITYRVRYRMGHPFWIETLDVAGLGVEPATSPASVRGAFRLGNQFVADCF